MRFRQIDFISLLTACKHCVVRQLSFLSLLCPFQPRLVVSLLTNHSQMPGGSSMKVVGIHSVGQEGPM